MTEVADSADTGRLIYLDNAATSYPKPPRVLEAVRSCLDQSLTVQRSTHLASFRGDEVLRRCRAKLARFIKARFPEEIVYTYSATDGLNIALNGLIPAGSHVITTPLEHHSVMRVLDQLRERSGVSWSFLPTDSTGAVDPAALPGLLRPETRTVVVNWISNVSGLVQPVAELGQIAKAHGLSYIVDAAQATGGHAVDVQAIHCDAMAQPGHKALLSLPGTGVLYIRREAEPATWRVGGTGYRSELESQPEERPMRFEAGTPNVPGIVGLDAALDWFDSVGGVSAVEARCSQLTVQLIHKLSVIPGLRLLGQPGSGGKRGHLVSFTLQGPDGSYRDPLQVSRLLAEEFGISSRAGLHCAPGAHRFYGSYESGGAVRLSIGWFTQEWMLEEAAAAIAQLQAAF